MTTGETIRTAVVTGASGGIGRAVALRLAGDGIRVAVCARGQQRLEDVAADVRRLGGTAVAVPADVRVVDDVDRLFTTVGAELGDPGILVHCAVESRVAPFLELTDDDWRQHFEVKVMGAVRCMRRAIPGMARTGWGRIVNVGGITARVVGNGRATNAVTNAAVTNLGKQLADELAPHGILVNTVHPGYTTTERLEGIVAGVAARDGTTTGDARRRLLERMPVGRFIEPGEVADLVAFLCSSRNTSITGQAIAVDGGFARSVTY